jgi:hypothetical protein
MTISSSAARTPLVCMVRKWDSCSRKMPARITREQARFFRGIFFPNSGVVRTPAMMVSCQVAATNQDSP